MAGREWLRRLFKDGKLVLTPMADRVYIARGELLPLMLMSEKTKDRRSGVSESTVSSCSSGGLNVGFAETVNDQIPLLFLAA